MFDKLSLLLQNKLEEVKKELRLNGIFQLGTEGLLYALLEMDNSICNHLFISKGIEKEKVVKRIKQLFILRKDNKEYTEKFIEVLENAQKIALLDESDLIYDEHLLYSLLMINDSVALNLIISFGLTVDEMVNNVKNIFDFKDDNIYLINLSKEAENKKLNTFVLRKKYIEKIIKILSKKQKNNPMLIGNAGVGKSALVEGVAIEYLSIDKNVNVYRLDIGMVLAGTKYRGDLEERLIEVIESVKGENNILFIDEIHNIVGNNNENSIDIANILKPILARNEIKCIGATTLDEYYKYIAKDKALSRRFQNIFVEEPNDEEMRLILKGIVKDYESFYNVKYSNDLINYIIKMSKLLTNRCFPDKAIDILDESGLSAKNNKRKNVKKEDVKITVYEFLGIDYNNFKKSIHKKINYSNLKKYYYDYFFQITERKTILNIMINNNILSNVISDFKKVLKITDEMILEIDLLDYLDSHYISNLLGSPSGYVGYEDGGIITEHVYRYPLSVIIIKNYESGNFIIKRQVDNIIKKGEIIDSKGRKINFRNCIFVFINSKKNIKHIGFNFQETIENIDYLDEVILENKDSNNKNKLQIIKKIIKNYSENNFFIKINTKIEDKNIDNIIEVLKNIENFNQYKNNIIKENDNGKIIVEKK